MDLPVDASGLFYRQYHATLPESSCCYILGMQNRKLGFDIEVKSLLKLLKI